MPACRKIHKAIHRRKLAYVSAINIKEYFSAVYLYLFRSAAKECQPYAHAVLGRLEVSIGTPIAMLIMFKITPIKAG